MNKKRDPSELIPTGDGEELDEMQDVETRSYADVASALGATVDDIASKENELHGKMSQLQTEVEKYKEKTLRAMAEVDNIRRIAQRDIANAHKFGVEKIIQDLIAVLDSLERALEVTNIVSENEKSMYQGIDLTLKMFLDILTRYGVTQTNPVGETFNPEWHEAVSVVMSAEQAPNTILSVLQRGYLLNGRVLRPARVVVIKAPA